MEGTTGTDGVDILRGVFGRAPLYLDLLRAIVALVSGSGMLAPGVLSTDMVSGGCCGLEEHLDPLRSLRGRCLLSVSISCCFQLGMKVVKTSVYVERP